MIRIVIENILLFLLPTALYVAYVLLRKGTATPGEVISEAPLIWLFAAGAIIVISTLVYFAATNPGGRPGQVYIPPHMKNGRIEPGQLR